VPVPGNAFYGRLNEILEKRKITRPRQRQGDGADSMTRTQEAGTAGDGRMESTSLPCASATPTISGVTGHFRVARPGGEFWADKCSFVGRIANLPLKIGTGKYGQVTACLA
jgi:hypothetical protein